MSRGPEGTHLRQALGERVLIITHELVRGAPQELAALLNQLKLPQVTVISNPLLAGWSIPARVARFAHGESTETTERAEPALPHLLRYVLHIVLTLRWGWQRAPYSTIVCVDPLNVISGVILRALGRGRCIVYYTIDYVPKRFSNPVMNWVYHRVDRWAVRRADVVWNVSSRISDARKMWKDTVRLRAKQIVVPIGVHATKQPTGEPTHPHRVAFIANLLAKQGTELIIRAMPKVRERIPDADLLIVGDGEERPRLERLVSTLRLDAAVEFAGLIRDRARWEPMLANCGVGVAPYLPDRDSFTYFADPTKPKDYLSLGLPVVLTDIPHYAREIEAKGAGLVVEPDPAGIAAAVLQVIEDPARRATMSHRATEMARGFDWRDVFEEAGEATLMVSSKASEGRGARVVR